MKYPALFSIALLLTVALFFSCHRGDPSSEILNRVDTLLEKRPDSALILLKSMNSGSFSDHENARYCLLMTIATIKNSLPVVSDSLIGISLEYYKENGDSLDKAKTFFYAGRVHQDMNDDQEAINHFLKATDYSTYSKDYKLNYLIHYYLGDLYFNQGLYNSALKMQKKALHFSRILNDSSYITYALRSCALSYAGKKMIKVSLSFYFQALRTLSANDTDIRITLYNEIGERYNDIGNHSLALKYVNKAIALKPSPHGLFYCDIIKANSFFYMQRFDSAQYYYKRSLLSPNIFTRAVSYKRLAEIASKENDYKKGLELMQIYDTCIDSIDAQTKSATIIEMENLYHHRKAKEQIQQLILEKKEQTIDFYHWGIGAFVIIVTLSGSFWVYRSNEKKKLQDKSQRLLEQENRLIMMREKDCRLREDFFRKLNRVKKIPSLGLSDEKGNNLSSDATTKISLSDHEWEELIRNIDVAYDHFSDRLKKAYPNLNNQDIRLCCLVKIKVARNDLANIFCITPQSVKTTKYRIKKDKMGINDREITLDHFLENF